MLSRIINVQERAQLLEALDGSSYQVSLFRLMRSTSCMHVGTATSSHMLRLSAMAYEAIVLVLARR